MYTHTQCSHYVNYKSSSDDIHSICIVLIDTYIHNHTYISDLYLLCI